MHPGLELVGEMKRLRRAPEPTSAMEPWLQKAVDAKLLIEKNTRVRSSDGSKAVARAGSGPCTSTRARPSSLLRARLTPSRHTSRCAHGLHCHGSAGCRGPGPQRVPVMALGRRSECAEGGTL